MGLTINYGPKPKVTAPEPLPKAPYAPKAYEAVFNITGKGIIGKLYGAGVVPHANDKEFMLVTKTGLMVHSVPWPTPTMYAEFMPFTAGKHMAATTAPQQLKSFLTGAMNDAFLKLEAFKAKTEASVETERRSSRSATRRPRRSTSSSPPATNPSSSCATRRRCISWSAARKAAAAMSWWR